MTEQIIPISPKNRRK